MRIYCARDEKDKFTRSEIPSTRGEIYESPRWFFTPWYLFKQPDPRPARKFTALKDVKDESSIEDLTIKQLKEILTANFVDYKGCCEKRELIERVRRLWQDSQKNQQKGESNKILLGVPQLKNRDGINLFFFNFHFQNNSGFFFHKQ